MFVIYKLDDPYKLPVCIAECIREIVEYTGCTEKTYYNNRKLNNNIVELHMHGYGIEYVKEC